MRSLSLERGGVLERHEDDDGLLAGRGDFAGREEMDSLQLRAEIGGELFRSLETNQLGVDGGLNLVQSSALGLEELLCHLSASARLRT
jgi:hypothetical protein